MERTSLKTIAEKVGVTPSTVSRVLRNDPTCYINKERKEKIFYICKRYNYKPNNAARSLVLGKNFSVAFASGHFSDLELTGPFLMASLDAIAETLKKSGYSCPMVTVLCSEDIENLCRETNHYDAVIIGRNILKSDCIEYVRKSEMPVVILDDDSSHLRDITRIGRNKQAGADAGIDYLISMGHRKIAIFGYGPHLGIFKAACGKKGIDISESDIYECPWCNTYEESMTGYVYADSILKNLKKYTAVCCATDIIALGFYKRLENAGIRPGRDISLLGFDNIEDYMSIPEEAKKLTSVHNSHREMGRICAETALNLIEGKIKTGKSITIPCTLKVRSSVLKIN